MASRQQTGQYSRYGKEKQGATAQNKEYSLRGHGCKYSLLVQA